MSKLTLISSATASGSTNVSFTSGIDSTYDEYVFYFVDINPASDAYEFTFQASSDAGVSYATTITSTAFRAYHSEDNASAALNYDTARDQAQGTAYQSIAQNVGNGADECCAGELHLFSPSSTTYVKHFLSRSNQYWNNNSSGELYIGGYFNTTSALNAIDFKMSSGNFDGNIYMFGAS